MPKTQPARPDPAFADSLTSADPIHDRAEALWRWSIETCHQHERFCRMIERTSEVAELRAAEELVKVCERSLATMVQAYEKATAKTRPAADEAWWHCANSLWHACREYTRRHEGCDRVSRRLRDAHSRESLGELQMEYELEASALLALRHAADAYRKSCPAIHQPSIP